MTHDTAESRRVTREAIERSISHRFGGGAKGLPLYEQPIVITDSPPSAPVLRVSKKCPMTANARREMNRWLKEVFGLKPAVNPVVSDGKKVYMPQEIFDRLRIEYHRSDKSAQEVFFDVVPSIGIVQ